MENTDLLGRRLLVRIRHVQPIQCSYSVSGITSPWYGFIGCSIHPGSTNYNPPPVATGREKSVVCMVGARGACNKIGLFAVREGPRLSIWEDGFESRIGRHETHLESARIDESRWKVVLRDRGPIREHCSNQRIPTRK